jgi:hypothetical protein
LEHAQDFCPKVNLPRTPGKHGTGGTNGGDQSNSAAKDRVLAVQHVRTTIREAASTTTNQNAL